MANLQPRQFGGQMELFDSKPLTSESSGRNRTGEEFDAPQVSRKWSGAIPGQMVLNEGQKFRMVEGHGTVHDPSQDHRDFRAWGPQFGLRNLRAWNENQELTTLRADSPVSSLQDYLRYDPNTGGPWRHSIVDQTRNFSDASLSDSHGALGRLDFSNPYDRPAVLKINGEHRVVDGHHRLYAARSRGVENIPVRLLDADRYLAEHGRAPGESLA